MQRPERFGTQEFLTSEEVKQDRIRQAERRHALDAAEAELVVDPQAPPVADDPGGYNTFWYENASIGENVRTSLIIYPENGQLPSRVEGAAEHTANKIERTFLVSVQFFQFWGYWRRWAGGSWFIRALSDWF